MDLFDAGAHEDALRRIDQAIHIRPDYSMYHMAKADFLRDMGRLQEAKQTAEHSVTLEPRSNDHWALLGLVNQDLGLYEEAAKCFRQAVRMKPESHVLGLLAHAELRFDPAQAAIDARKALELDPDAEESDETRATLEEAEQALERGADRCMDH